MGEKKGTRRSFLDSFFLKQFRSPDLVVLLPRALRRPALSGAESHRPRLRPRRRLRRGLRPHGQLRRPGLVRLPRQRRHGGRAGVRIRRGRLDEVAARGGRGADSGEEVQAGPRGLPLGRERHRRIGACHRRTEVLGATHEAKRYDNSVYSLDFRSPLEVHLVHYDDAKYSSLEEASKNEDGVVILAFLHEVSSQGASQLDFLSTNSESLRPAGSKVENIALESVQDLVEGMDTSEYFSYHGSMTRPPCYNTITWIVFKDKLKVNHDQLESLRGLEDKLGRSIVKNYRPLQPLKGRRPIFVSDNGV